MIESHLNEGRQDVPNEGPQGLKHGVSITDACVDWERTVTMMDKLNAVCNQRLTLLLTSLMNITYLQAVGQRRNTIIEAGLQKPERQQPAEPSA